MNDLFEPVLEDATPGVPAILPLYGGAKKPVSQMTEEEFSVAARAIHAKVREQAFSRGLPIVIERDGQVIREYADGRIEVVS